MSESTREARVERLKQAARDKSEAAQSRAQRAIISLENRGQPVNFNTVASEAGVSKDFLYRNQRLRKQVSERRVAPSRHVTPTSGDNGATTSAAVKLAVATKALRQFRIENARLRQENARLLGDLIALRRQRLS